MTIIELITQFISKHNRPFDDLDHLEVDLLCSIKGINRHF